MYDLSKTFAVVQPDLSVTPIAVTPDVYERLDREFDGFRGRVLVSFHAFERDWPTWERHPGGDEIVVLLAGEAEFLLEAEHVPRRVRLRKAGEFVVVPRGTWHTARVAERAEMLFITPGEGTQNEERP